MPKITPYSKYIEEQNYIQEFRQKDIRIIEVQTQNNLDNGIDGVELFPNENGGVRMDLFKIAYRTRRTVTGDLKIIHYGIKKRITMSFAYMTQEEKDRLEIDMFREDSILYLSFFDQEHTKLFPSTDPRKTDKIRVKMINQLQWSVKPISTAYKAGEITSFGEKTFKGMAVYTGITAILEEI